ncbi:hypothetical protein Bca101_042704 [Brassica carinata]
MLAFKDDSYLDSYISTIGIDFDVEDKDGDGGDVKAVTEEERLGDLLKRESLRPDVMLAEGEGDNEDDVLLPWDKNEEV